MAPHRNLSEKLFKPHFNYPETSSLVRRIDANNHRFTSILDGEAERRWYRILNFLSWHWRGTSLIEIGEVLSRIAAADKKRSVDEWLDTVIGYQSGNWSYEFLAQSAKWQSKAEQLTQEEDKEACFSAWLQSSAFAVIASYPHYRTDDLASQAQVFANRAFREAMNRSPYQVKDIDFVVDKRTIKTTLHTPLLQDETPRAFPIVFLCSGLSDLQIDFYHYFSTYLAPAGIGLLTVDSPSIGASKQFNLTQNTSILHQSILEQIKSVLQIDDRNIILMGYRFGANIATRLAYLMPNRVKGLINVAPIVHELFVKTELQNSLPTMYKDMIAQRLGLNTISNQQLLAELKFFSLREQRLLTRPCNVPLLNISFEGDLLSSEDEGKLLRSVKTSSILIKKASYKESLMASSVQSIKWMKALINN